MPLYKKFILLFADIFFLAASLVATLLIRYPAEAFGTVWNSHTGPFLIVVLLWLFVFYLADLYRQKAFRDERTLWQTFLGAVAVASMGSVVMFYLFGDFFRLTPKTNLALFVLIFSFLDHTWRYFFLVVSHKGRVPVIMIGNSPRITETVSYLSHNPSAGYYIAEWIQKITPETAPMLESHIRSVNAAMVIIQPQLTKDQSMVRALYRLLPLETSLLTFLDFYELIFEKMPLDELEEGWFVEHISTRRPFYDALKRIADFLLALALSIIFIIPALFIGLLIGATSHGPVIYRQKRAGKNGAAFTLYKFRSMHHGDKGPLWTEKNDGRLTSVGKFLRFTHLDELPQLWNALRGDVSFTGPRPERVELAEHYASLPYYEIRHIVKPGITGWAQINYKPSASLEEARAKLEYDIYYVKNRSFFLDTSIVLRTIRYVFMSHE